MSFLMPARQKTYAILKLSPLRKAFDPYPPKGGLRNSMIFRCSPLGLGVKQMKIIEFYTFRSMPRTESNEF